MAKIDIIIPCYRYGRYLAQCVGSVLEQSLADLRVLIIDDASPDETAEVAERLATGDRRVHVIRHAENRGHIATYNEGLDWVTADYLLLLSADDLLVPGALQRAVTLLDDNPDVVLAYGGCIDWDERQPLPALPVRDDYQWVVRRGRDFISELCAAGYNPVRTVTAIVRTAVQRRVGGYRPHLWHSADCEMWLRLAAHGSVARTDGIQGIYRLHGASMSTSYFRDVRTEHHQNKAAFDGFFDEYADRLSWGRDFRRVADSNVAERAFWTGIAQICRGHQEEGRWLLRFAIGIKPRLRYYPPLGRILRTPGAGSRAASALKALLTPSPPVRRDEK
jgi:glycosyltransferase involved in cell wall biosynthesis